MHCDIQSALLSAPGCARGHTHHERPDPPPECHAPGPSVAELVYAPPSPAGPTVHFGRVSPAALVVSLVFVSIDQRITVLVFLWRTWARRRRTPAMGSVPPTTKAEKDGGKHHNDPHDDPRVCVVQLVLFDAGD